MVFEASWFVYLAAAGDHAFGLAFMAPDHPSQPPGAERFNGQGMGRVLQEAQTRRVPVRLQVLRANTPARRLYERLGFVVTGETATHFQMEKRSEATTV